MSDEREFTERDVVLLERRAFRAGIEHATAKPLTAPHEYPDGPCSVCDAEAARRYPLPKVTRPRVVNIPGMGDYRVVDGRLEWKGYCDGWTTVYSAETFNRLADLLGNPTEEVEAES